MDECLLLFKVILSIELSEDLTPDSSRAFVHSLVEVIEIEDLVENCQPVLIAWLIVESQ